MHSKAYTKKWNLSSDKAQWTCWEVHIRTTTYDLFVTVLRRKYIPPLMDIFQDIVCISNYPFNPDISDEENSRKSFESLDEVHRASVDSLYT